MTRMIATNYCRPKVRTTRRDGQCCPDRTLDRAFADFVRANTPALTRTAYLLTGGTSAAEELVQDTLVRLYPKWEKVQAADVPVAYVRRALTNHFLNQLRTANREVITDEVPERPSDRSAENDFVDRDEVWALLRTLGTRQRAAIVLRYYEGLSDAEVGAALGARPGTVRSLISRGLATLRETAHH